MIIIRYTDNEITALGHSGYDKPNKDIVCAAVSTAFKMSVGILTELDVKLKFESEAKTGFIGIQVDKQDIKKAKSVTNTLIYALKSIATSYPKFIQVHRTVAGNA